MVHKVIVDDGVLHFLGDLTRVTNAGHASVSSGCEAKLIEVLVHPGELFGCTSLLAEEPYSLSAEALQACELCVFSAAAFFGSVWFL